MRVIANHLIYYQDGMPPAMPETEFELDDDTARELLANGAARLLGTRGLPRAVGMISDVDVDWIPRVAPEPSSAADLVVPPPSGPITAPHQFWAHPQQSTTSSSSPGSSPAGASAQEGNPTGPALRLGGVGLRARLQRGWFR